MTKEFLFKDDIVVIDDKKYRRKDIGKLMADFAGKDERSPFLENIRFYTVEGEHRILGFNVSSFCVEYDRNTGLIMDYILQSPDSIGSLTAAITKMLGKGPQDFSGGFVTAKEWILDGGKKVAVTYSDRAPDSHNIVLMWM